MAVLHLYFLLQFTANLGPLHYYIDHHNDVNCTPTQIVTPLIWKSAAAMCVKHSGPMYVCLGQSNAFLNVFLCDMRNLLNWWQCGSSWWLRLSCTCLFHVWLNYDKVCFCFPAPCGKDTKFSGYTIIIETVFTFFMHMLYSTDQGIFILVNFDMIGVVLPINILKSTRKKFKIPHFRILSINPV